MNGTGRRFRLVIAAIAGMTLCWVVPQAIAQTNDKPGILFLHLQFKNNSVSLIKASVQPGHLKPRPHNNIPDGLHLDLYDGDGRQLWHTVIEDPVSRWVEYEDPPGSRKLKRKKVQLGETEFIVRIPALANARQIEFYRLEKTTTLGKDERRKSLGRLALTMR